MLTAPTTLATILIDVDVDVDPPPAATSRSTPPRRVISARRRTATSVPSTCHPRRADDVFSACTSATAKPGVPGCGSWSVDGEGGWAMALVAVDEVEDV